MVAEWRAGSTYSVDMLDKGVIYIQGEMEKDGVKFYHTTQNSVQFETYELFIWIFPFTIFGRWLTVEKVVYCTEYDVYS